jgi:hypothetical protein
MDLLIPNKFSLMFSVSFLTCLKEGLMNFGNTLVKRQAKVTITGVICLCLLKGLSGYVKHFYKYNGLDLKFTTLY